MPRFVLALIGGCAATTLIAGAALADPPGRVGRISDVEGDVSFLPPGADDWTWAERNFPVTTGESFWTQDDGRVELQAGAVEVRADSDTEVDVLALDYGQTRLGLTQGSVDLRLWRVPEGGVTVATPAGDVEINEAGVYRIDVGAAQEDGSYPPVELTVFEGDAGAPGPQGFADVEAGEAALIYAGYDPEFTDAQDASIDDWARSREQNERWYSQADFAPAMTGYEDLGGQGEFVSDPTYGTVWFPSSVPDDWAPYRFGHWAWVQPWGYTWIDDQPWGFAPFHYGRWVQVDGRWGWVPGQRESQPVYAPALVAFFGVGASIGWAPLAPDEVYRPTYDVSDTYWRRVNAANVRPEVIQNVTINTTVNFTSYRNASAAVAVNADTLSRGGRVQGAAARVAPEQLTQAAPVKPHTIAPPTAAAIAGGGPKVNAAGGARPAPPPSHLQAVRASIAAAPAGSTRPPAIPGARIVPPQPKPSGAPAFIAPAQKKNPELQARKPIAPPAANPRPNGSQPAERPMNRPIPPANGQPYQEPNRSNPNAGPNTGAENPAGRPMYRRPPPPNGEQGSQPNGRSPSNSAYPSAGPNTGTENPGGRPAYRRPPPPYGEQGSQPNGRSPSNSAYPNVGAGSGSEAPAERPMYRRPPPPNGDQNNPANGRAVYRNPSANPRSDTTGNESPQRYGRPQNGVTEGVPARPGATPSHPSAAPPENRPATSRPSEKATPQKEKKPKPDENQPPQ